MLVCICPLSKKHPASPTSCTIQPEHIDYTAHGGRIKARGIVFLTDLLRWGQYQPWWAEHLLQRVLHWAFPEPAGAPKSKTDLLKRTIKRWGQRACTPQIPHTVQSTNIAHLDWFKLCSITCRHLNTCYALISPGGQRIDGKIQLISNSRLD